MKPKKPYWEMTAEELGEATREFDREMPGLPGKPLTSAMRKRLANANKRALSRRSQCLEHLPVILDHELVRKADAMAKKLHITRSELIAQALRTVFRAAG
jgi:hypothetical protein